VGAELSMLSGEPLKYIEPDAVVKGRGVKVVDNGGMGRSATEGVAPVRSVW
jgi:hypothetical protein